MSDYKYLRKLLVFQKCNRIYSYFAFGKLGKTFIAFPVRTYFKERGITRMCFLLFPPVIFKNQNLPEFSICRALFKNTHQYNYLFIIVLRCNNIIIVFVFIYYRVTIE